MTKMFQIVPFHQYQILTAHQGDEVEVPLKALVDQLGLAWHPQLERIKRHPVLSKGIRVTRIPSQGGMQETVALSLEMLPGFLTTIQSERIKDPIVRERVTLFQEEAFHALFVHFFGGRRGTPAALASGATNELLKLTDRLKHEWHPEIKAMLHALLGQMCDRMNLPLPRIEAFGQPAPDDLEIADGFFAGLIDLKRAGVDFDHHRRADLLAISLPQIDRLFTAASIDAPRGAPLRRALRQHPAFIEASAVNGRDTRIRRCWIFDRSKLPELESA